MSEHHKSITYQAGRYVLQLLRRKLPTGYLFHNIHHTLNVVQGVVQIGRAEGVADSELEILLLAAWFHDTGHVETYQDHETVSSKLAGKWLSEHQYPLHKIAIVQRCILATRLPQQPADHLERILCDADLHHLSFPTYDHYQDLLREEWKLRLGIEMTDAEWEEQNDRFLRDHHYWTTYGQTVLEDRKNH